MEGTCSECGLVFAWADVFDPVRSDLRGFVEHVRTPVLGWASFRAAFRTWAWTAWPGRFYARVLMTHRFDWRRMLLWPLLILLPLHALASALGSVRIAAFPRTFGSMTGVTGWQVVGYLSSWTFPIASLQPSAIGTMWPPQIVWLLSGAPAYVYMALAMHGGYAALMLVLPTTRRIAKLRIGHIARAAVYGLAWVPLLCVFRAARNGLLLVQAAATPMPAGWPGVGAPGPRPVRLADFGEEPIRFLLMAWVALWWLSAMRRGWKLSEYWLVWGVLTVAAVLTALTMDATLGRW